MTQGERVRTVRKSLSLTMERFATRIGVAKSTISNIENGNRNATEHMIKSICREFDISEEWLRDGTGEPYIEKSRSDVIAEFSGRLMRDEDESFRRRLVEALAKLDIEDWEALEKVAQKIMKKD